MNVWRLITHHENPEAALEWSRKNTRIAMGWGRVGDLNTQNYTSAQEITRVARDQYPDLHNVPFSGKQLWNFRHIMKPHDLVILSTGKYRAAVMQIQGPYEYHTSEESPLAGDYQHQRHVIKTDYNADRLWRLAMAQPAAGQSIRWTLIQCLQSLDAESL